MKLETEHRVALEEAVEYVMLLWEHEIPMIVAEDLIEVFLVSLDSEDRDFSDEMIEARKTFHKLTEEQPEECPSKLWEDALALAKAE